MSQDEEYKYPGNSKDIWEYTSKWKPIQLELLKIQVTDGNECNIVGVIDINNLELYADSQRILLPCDNIKNKESIKSLTREQLIFFNRLLQLTVFDDKPPVDAVTSDLLTYSGFECDTIHFRPRPRLRFTYMSHNITSIPDYGVFIERSNGLPANEYFVVVENKAVSNYDRQYRECQLCGEMLASAINRYNEIHNDKIMFGALVSGLEVRFYKVIFSASYLLSIVNDKVPSGKATIMRFPSANNYPLSLNNKETREKIIRILHAIRIQLETITLI